MIKGLYAAASAMLARLNQQTVLAHNAANIDTPGFKQVLTALQHFTYAPVIQPAESVAINDQMRYVGYVGLGTETTPEETDYTEGGMQYTGQTYDFAINGPGFFRVQTQDGERYTRDGRFNRDAENQLVTIDGYKVLDDGGQPIVITDEGELSVSAEGMLYLDGNEVAQLGIASFADPATELSRDQTNLFNATGQPTGETTGAVIQGYLEGSNVNASQIMTQMVQVTRNYEAAQKMVQNQDDLLGRTIGTLGRLG